jgi:hypothetical protein
MLGVWKKREVEASGQKQAGSVAACLLEMKHYHIDDRLIHLMVLVEQLFASVDPCHQCAV